MGGVAGVAVHPDARGAGVASRLLRHVAERMAERGQPVSALFPTIGALYRGLGWEVVGTLTDSRLVTRDLLPQQTSSYVLRTAEQDADAAVVHDLYTRWATAGAGGLTRDGPMFTGPAADAFESDVVALVEDAAGVVRGYAAYDRGRGYQEGAELRVWDVVAEDAGASRALLRSLAGWHPVAGLTRWRGPLQDVALLTVAPVPPPTTVRPWMLRVVDPAGAVAARGFPSGVAVETDLSLLDDGTVTHWHLSVGDGQGSLEPAAAGGAAVLHVRGLALLYAGSATTATLVRTGLLDRPQPALDAVFAGPAPVLLDYF
jgi:predicted acetyltransferase